MSIRKPGSPEGEPKFEQPSPEQQPVFLNEENTPELYNRVVVFLVNLCKNSNFPDPQELAVELAQQTMVKMLATKSPSTATTENGLASWAFTIARNLFNDTLRGRLPGIYNKVTAKPWDDIAEEELVQSRFYSSNRSLNPEKHLVNMVYLKQFLDQLNPEDRQLIIWREVEEREPKEIAKLLSEREGREVKPGTVRIRLLRAREKLSYLIEEVEKRGKSKKELTEDVAKSQAELLNRPELSYDPSVDSLYSEKFLSHLKPEDRQVLIWKEVEGLKLREIASRLGKSINAVKQQSFKARKNLAELRSRLKVRKRTNKQSGEGAVIEEPK